MLRGLPSTEIVGHALRQHAIFKFASEIFLERPPDESAAAALIEAFEAGEAPAWMTAHLLGCLRAPAGYEIVRQILISAPGLLAESYAGPALARIAGPAARDDLLDLMRRGQHRRAREGALGGLGELGDKSVVPPVLEAVRDRLVGRHAAGAIVRKLKVSATELAAWLQSSDEDARHVAIDAISGLSATEEGVLRDTTLVTAALEAVRAGAVRLSPSARGRLEKRLGEILAARE
jgi:HEAT repeat protein